MKNEQNQKLLPINELEQLGLVKNGRPLLKDEDLEALLSGRRTDMIALQDVHSKSFVIKQLDAKLSLSTNGDENPILNIHPIYKEVKPHPLLNKTERNQLESAQLQSVLKDFKENGRREKVVIEFDKDTREYVSYNPKNIQAPQKVNGISLSEKQKEAFKQGEVVELDVDTIIQHAATESKGIKSDRSALILSVLLDGGISYLLLRGVKNLTGNSEQNHNFSEGYKKALEEMKSANSYFKDDFLEEDRADVKQQYSRGYGSKSSR
ncbi:MAG: hypothetical protein JWQ25_592 [Daejeonella sp.]|nr:hypothetical protein [Daejeonella sp.]